MKIVILVAVSLLFVACSTQKMSEKEYYRANTASEKAHDKFDKE